MLLTSYYSREFEVYLISNSYSEVYVSYYLSGKEG